MADTISMRMIEDHKTSETKQGCDQRKEATMANITFNLLIPSGTIVFRNVNGKCKTVTLLSDCHISGATKELDGGFSYHVCGHEFYTSAGGCMALVESVNR